MHFSGMDDSGGPHTDVFLHVCFDAQMKEKNILWFTNAGPMHDGYQVVREKTGRGDW